MERLDGHGRRSGRASNLEVNGGLTVLLHRRILSDVTNQQNTPTQVVVSTGPVAYVGYLNSVADGWLTMFTKGGKVTVPMSQVRTVTPQTNWREQVAA